MPVPEECVLAGMFFLVVLATAPPLAAIVAMLYEETKNVWLVLGLTFAAMLVVSWWVFHVALTKGAEYARC